MYKSSRTRRTFSAIGMLAGSLAISCLLPLRALAKDYTQLNVFGDSLVDAGNFFNLSGGTFPPSPPYAQRFSNGPVWVEQLGAELGIMPALSSTVVPGLFAGTALPPAEGINFAVAGSLSSNANVGGSPLPGLQQQIAAFGAISAATPPDVVLSTEALSILLAGSNDYNEGILKAASAEALAALPEQVTDNLVAAVAGLANAGAKDILVSNLPNLGLQPFAKSLNAFNPQSSNLLAALSTQHNQLLSQKLTAFAVASDTEIIQFDLDSVTAAIAARPTEFGFTNVEEACLTNFQPDNTFDGICSDPDTFFFWDNVHPTTAGHSVIAQAALRSLNAADPTEPTVPPDTASVPEPSGVLGLLAVSGTMMMYAHATRLAHRI